MSKTCALAGSHDLIIVFNAPVSPGVLLKTIDVSDYFRRIRSEACGVAGREQGGIDFMSPIRTFGGGELVLE